MKTRLFDKDKDYASLCTWWVSHKWNIMPLVTLPKTGLIIEDVCACFLYTTDSDVMALAFPISNPKKTDEERSEGLDLLLHDAKTLAKERGARLLVTKASNKSLIERYKQLDFKIIDTDVPSLVCELE